MLIKFLKNFFKRPVIIEENVEVIKKLTRKEMIDSIDFVKFNLPKVDYNNKDESIFLLDDIELSELLYRADFDLIKDVYNLNIEENYNLILSLGPACGYSAIKYIRNSDIKITHAILDLTLGHIEIMDNGAFIEIDGVDIAIELYKHNPDVKVLFSTAHSLDNRNNTVKYYFTKFKENTGKSLENHYLNKNGNRKEVIYKLLKDS